MLYTIMPEEVVLDGWETPYKVASFKIRELEVIARVDASGGATIERIISTDPAVYLNPEMAPGKSVALPISKFEM